MSFSKALTKMAILAFFLASFTAAAAHLKANQLQARQAAQIDPKTLNACSNPQIEFGGGFGNRAATELTFRPADAANFAHGEAKIMCDTLVNKCGFKNADKTFTDCKSIEASVGAGNNGALADKWNAGFGISTNFAATGAKK
ncbi:expressed protein [Phakopsora pachyrhizi]|uniref:Expressed protein n=1 Tax=Phakopsora pachyrhizi TaxID=170000 RepID=A0AAV0BRW2_PHAPC|nr:hypothetical protein PPACK8108_LOCUS25449 [Phakopsora pachyrhizi]CAH7690184.1 expressed protein [Phakopsora pachyrhizi]